MKLKLLVAAISMSLALTPNVAMAEWIYITSSKNVEFYVDDSSVEPQENTVYLWEKEVMRRPYKGVAKTFIIQSAYDCNNQTITTIQATAYNSAGKLINNSNLIPSLGTKKAIPGTAGAAIWRAVCE